MARSKELQHFGLAPEVGEHDDPPPATEDGPLRTLASRAHLPGRDAKTLPFFPLAVLVVSEYGLF